MCHSQHFYYIEPLKKVLHAKTFMPQQFYIELFITQSGRISFTSTLWYEAQIYGHYSPLSITRLSPQYLAYISTEATKQLACFNILEPTSNNWDWNRIYLTTNSSNVIKMRLLNSKQLIMSYNLGGFGIYRRVVEGEWSINFNTSRDAVRFWWHMN